MLMAHKVVDALLGRDSRLRRLVLDPKMAAGVASDLEEAEKFDFGPLVTEVIDAGSGTHRLPQLTPDELGFWVDGLLPLPFPVSWYEFVLVGFRSGLLIEGGDSGRWAVVRVDWVGDTASCDCVITELDRDETRKNGAVSVRLFGRRDYVDRLHAAGRDTVVNNFAASGTLAIYLTLMLNSKTSEVVREQAPRKLNEARAKRGVCPLFDHRVVTIVPARFMRGEARGGTHASPRLHWRRSHVRVLHRGGAGERRVVIPRFLVGKAELGEVSHEYRVGQPQREKATP
jgi:hypothetical protein